MITRNEYDHLRQEVQRLHTEIATVTQNYHSNYRQKLDAVNTAIATLFQQFRMENSDLIQLKQDTQKLVQSHSKEIADLSSEYHQGSHRLLTRLWDVIQEINSYQNVSFMLAMRHFGYENFAESIHWEIYFRYKKFSKFSGVIFLQPDETEWEYPDGEIGTITELEAYAQPDYLRMIRWFEGYSAKQDVLVIKIPPIDSNLFS